MTYYILVAVVLALYSIPVYQLGYVRGKLHEQVRRKS
jgi:hypothetical protein